MALIDAAQLTNEDLAGYDFLMMQALAARHQIAGLPIRLWNEVLVELGNRGLAEALEGSLSDVTTARIRRSYPLPASLFTPPTN